MGDTGSTSEYDSEHPDDKAAFVKEYPKISQTLKDFKLIEGSDATFVCKVSGRPRPKVCQNIYLTSFFTYVHMHAYMHSNIFNHNLSMKLYFKFIFLSMFVFVYNKD